MTVPATAPAGTRRRPVPVTLAAGTVLLEVGYPRVHGTGRDALTVATVVTFFLASVSHAAVWRGRRWTIVLVTVTAGTGLLVESVGTRTGVPFGAYTYTATLGPRLLGVPLVIPLAWTMMAYPALLAARRLVAGRWSRALVAGAALAAWDLFLDPQMVAAGHWRWTDVGAALPGIPEVPLTNFLGWTLTAVAMMAGLTALLPAAAPAADDGVPLALYLWTYASSVLANLAFFHRPAVALAGGLGMGLVAVPLAVRLWRR